MESQMATPGFSSSVSEAERMEAAEIAERQLAAAEDQCLLPQELHSSIPPQDRQWIGKALFCMGPQGQPQLDAAKVDQMWYHPPGAPVFHPKMPHPDRYFAHRLCLWFPHKLWNYSLQCPHPDCDGCCLTSAGICGKTVRQVLDINNFYLLMGENLECWQCGRKVVSWHDSLLSQLDLGHRCCFPAILTYRYAADKQVVRLLRQRGLGNGLLQIWRGLRERHSEAWLDTSALYMADVKAFKDASPQGLISGVQPESPPNLLEHRPSYSWLRAVYVRDVLQQLDDIRAAVTSTFGSILKMDSTKKIVNRMAGHAQRTAWWHTNVGNEHGQVLMSVVTAQEGGGLQTMAEGLVRRYSEAGVQPPAVLYVHRDCCSDSEGNKGKISNMFASWPSLHVRLDVWHFMRRLASGVNTESHPLYASFMSAMSLAIFEWDRDDLDALKAAKRSQMQVQGVAAPCDAEVGKRISKRELTLHCRRATRGVEETTELLEQLLRLYTQPLVTDSRGVPLLDACRMWQIWEEQKRHVSCIQDPEGVLLYQETAPMKKGGTILKTYRCARGSTSLESFHLHLSRFIPGTTASDLHYQVSLLDGLLRWNQDRAQAATGVHREPLTYSSLLAHAVNKLSWEVFHQPIFTGLTKPHRYTGELIGVEYLYSQASGCDLYTLPQSEEEEEEEEAEETDADDPLLEGEGFLEEEAEDRTLPSPDQVWRKGPPDLDTLPTLFLPPVVRLPQGQSTSAQIMETVTSTVTVTATASVTTTATTSATTAATSTTAATAATAATTAAVTSTSLGTATATATATVTLATATATATQLSPEVALPSAAEEGDNDAVDPDNVPGYAAVTRLAAYLVTLRDNWALTAKQAACIVSLYHQLSDYDKQPTVFPLRHREAMDKGRLRRSKWATGPGMGSRKRSFWGCGRGLRPLPDVNRISEAVVLMLMDIFPRSTCTDGRRRDRFSLVEQSYSRVQSMVLDNDTVYEQTCLQLPFINVASLRCWFKKRQARLERRVLPQPLSAHSPASVPLPPTRQQPAPRDEGHHDNRGNRHEVPLPPNTAGCEKARRTQGKTILPAAHHVATGLSLQIPLLVLPSPLPGSAPLLFTLPPDIATQVGVGGRGPTTSAAAPSAATTSAAAATPAAAATSAAATTQPHALHQLPRTSAWRQRKRAQLEQQLGVALPKRNRKEGMICSQCLCLRDTRSHGQYYGVWWCEAASPLPFPEWKRQQQLKRTIGKKSG